MPQLGWHMWAYGVLAVVLVASAATDIRTGKIYNVVTYPAIAVGLVGHTLAGGLWATDELQLGLVGSAGGLAAGFLPLLAAWLAGGIGGGDAKLMGAVGALAGWRFAVATMFYGFIIAAVMALAVMLKARVTRRTLKRIGRFIYLLLTPTKPADPAAEDSPSVALGLALCLGSAVALVEVLVQGPVAKKLALGI